MLERTGMCTYSTPKSAAGLKRTKELGLEAKMELERDSGGQGGDFIPWPTSWSSSNVQNWLNAAGTHFRFADFLVEYSFGGGTHSSSSQIFPSAYRRPATV